MKYLYLIYGVLCLQFVLVLCENKKEFPAPSQNAIETSDKAISSTSPPSTTSKPQPLKVCPDKNTPRPFFSLPCSNHKECGILGPGLLCCSGRCLKAVSPPKIEGKHEPVLFGLIDRRCPADRIPEIFDIKRCETDADCLPRICCPEKLKDGENVSFCRTAEPIWDKIPLANQVMMPLKAMVSYLQCTPPPPPVLDLFPKPCDNPLDCFPNLCCQEGDKRFCRPPKRSILALVADIGQRLVPSDAARALIERIS